MSEVAIKIEGIGKKYVIGKQKDSSLRGSLSGVLKKSIPKSEIFWALKDISFNVNKGDVIGVIGKNGAGKSTLLKILSQITKPTEGRIEINGRVASLLEVGTGFHPELTGRENIFLNGTILGMTRKEVKSKFDEIVEFSGVEKFIDTPVKHYSSGMYVRLAFAVAANLDPEILIIDEVLAVGDAEFQKKCLGKMKDVAATGRTVIFVSHNMAAVQSLCDKGVLIENGRVLANGTIKEVVHQYRNSVKLFTSNLKESLGVFNLLNHINKTTGELGMLKVLSYCDKKLSNIFYGGCNFSFEIEVENEEGYENLLYGFTIKNNSGEPIISMTNRHTGHLFSIKKRDKVIFKTEIPQLPIYREGEYFVDLYWGNHSTNHEVLIDAFSFEVEKVDVYGTGVMPTPKDNLIYVDSINFTLK